MDLKQLEKLMKLMEKYQMDTVIQHPDGRVELVKKLHVAPQPKAVPEPVVDPEKLLYAASRAPKISDFSRYSVSRIMPNQAAGEDE